jgi:hypothetical protein
MKGNFKRYNPNNSKSYSASKYLKNQDQSYRSVKIEPRCWIASGLSRPSECNVTAKLYTCGQRLYVTATIRILPLCYWHEYLDMVYLYKCLINNSDSNISIKIPTRETRNTSSTIDILLHVTKSKTVSFQNSFYIRGRAANVWKTLPCFIRNTTTSLTTFKFNLMKYYVELTHQIYDPEDPRTFKSVCINVTPLAH